MGLREIIKQAIFGAENAFGVSAKEPAATTRREPRDPAFIPEDYHEKPVYELTAGMEEVDCATVQHTNIRLNESNCSHTSGGSAGGISIPFGGFSLGGSRATIDQQCLMRVDEMCESPVIRSETIARAPAVCRNDKI